MPTTVIAGYARSPFTLAKKGALARVRADDMAAEVIRGLIAKTGVKPEDIEDIIVGSAFPEGEQGMNVARLIGLLADLPLNVGGMTVNRFCGSSMSSIHIAAGQIAIGAGEVFIAAGIESMSRVPMGGYNPLFNTTLNSKNPGAYMGMGQTAENVAANGKSPVTSRKISPSPATPKPPPRKPPASSRTKSSPSTAKPARWTRTAASVPAPPRKPSPASSSRSTRKAPSPQAPPRHSPTAPAPCWFVRKTTPRATTFPSSPASKASPSPAASRTSWASAPCAPPAKALERAGLSATDMDVVELNEAFSSQAIASMKEIGFRPETVNLDGGAIALGHPLGATGARIVGKAASLLKREGGRYAIATQCIGGGQGIATVLEAV